MPQTDMQIYQPGEKKGKKNQHFLKFSTVSDSRVAIFYLQVPQWGLISTAAEAVYGSGLRHLSSRLHPQLIELVPITGSSSAAGLPAFDGCRLPRAAVGLGCFPCSTESSITAITAEKSCELRATDPLCGEQDVNLCWAPSERTCINLFLSLFDLEVCQCH